MVSRESGNWATEDTLRRILDESKDAAELLRAIAGKSAKSAKPGEDPLKPASEETAKKISLFGQIAGSVAKKTQEDYKSALRNLQFDMQGFRQNLRNPAFFRGIYEGFDRQGQRVGNLMQDFADRVGGVASAFPVVGPMIGAAVGAFTGVIQQLFATRESFITLNQAGILFGGSLAQYNQALGNAGLSSEQFGAIVAQSGQAIRVFGERDFLQTTTALRNTFLDLGLTIQQGNEQFAEYIENTRLMGGLYMSTREQEQAAFEKTIRQQQELAILTGATVTEQRRAARERAASAQYRAMMMSLPKEERERLEGVARGMSAAGMDQKTIEGAIMQSAFGRTLPEFARMQALLPQQMRETIDQFVQTGSAANQQGFINALSEQARQFQGTPEMRMLATIMSGSSLEGPITSIVNLISQVSNMGVRTPEQQQALDNLRDNGRVIDQLTRDVGNSQELITRFLGMFQSFVNKFVTDNVLSMFTGQLDSLNTAMQAVSTAGAGEGFRALARSMGAGEAGTRVAEAFDRGIFAGLGAAVSEALDAVWKKIEKIFEDAWESLWKTLTDWGNNFIAGLRNILPGWLTGGNSQESRLMSPDVTRHMADIRSGRETAVAIPQAPAIAPGQTAAERLTPQQQAAMLMRARRLNAEAEGEVQAMAMGQGTVERQMALQEEANRLMARVAAAQEEANTRLRTINNSVTNGQ